METTTTNCTCIICNKEIKYPTEVIKDVCQGCKL